MHDYKSLRVAVIICVMLVNTRTHRQFLTGYTISSAILIQKVYEFLREEAQFSSGCSLIHPAGLQVLDVLYEQDYTGSTVVVS